MNASFQKTFVAVSVLAVCAAAEGAAFRRALERVASMDPIRAVAVYDAHAVALVYEPPLEVDYAARPYRLKPALCEMPEVSSDGRVYRFRLRSGARFHADPCFGADAAGRPRDREVTAEDFVYAFGRLGSRENASASMWLVEPVETTRALDARTFEVVLKKPLHVFPWYMSMPQAAVVPREAVARYGAKFGSVAVGTGPYRLAEWWRNHRMVFARNPAWPGWREMTHADRAFERVEYLVVDDESTKWLMFLSGEIDYLEGISRDHWDAVVGRDGRITPELAARGVSLHAAPALQVLYVGMNMKDPTLGPNRKLRQALNCAFDFPAWNRFFNNRFLPCDGPVPPGVEGRLETPFAYAFNVEKAKRLLTEAGYPGGVDPKTGRRLALEVGVGRATQTAREQIELMQSFYARVGVRLEPKYMTWTAFLKSVDEGSTALFQMGWVGDYPDAENFLQLFHSKNVSPGANHSCYANPAYDEAFDAALAAKTPEARNAAWRRAQEIVREDCPWIFTHYPKTFSLTASKIRGYKPTDFPYGEEKWQRAAP